MVNFPSVMRISEVNKLDKSISDENTVSSCCFGLDSPSTYSQLIWTQTTKPRINIGSKESFWMRFELK